MSAPGGSKGGAKTWHQSCTKLGTLVGPGKEFVMSEVATLMAVIQKGILIKERMMIEAETSSATGPGPVAEGKCQVGPSMDPVTITEKSLRQKIVKLWRRVEEVAQGKGKGGKKGEKEKVVDLQDKLLEVTTCPHTILSCSGEGSGCRDMKECKVKAHIQCSCPLTATTAIVILGH